MIDCDYQDCVNQGRSILTVALLVVVIGGRYLWRRAHR